MKEEEFVDFIKKSEFVFSNHFMGVSHNYLCACCKTNSAVQNCNTGILQPCWDCQKEYKVIKLNWFNKLIGR